MKLAIESLDRSRPFGQVYGETAHNIAFEQRGWPYDAHDNLIEAALKPEQVTKLTSLRDKAAAKVAELAALPAVAAEEAPLVPLEAEDDEDDLPPPPPKGDDDDGVNLAAWLKGEIRYRPFEVQNAVKTRYGVNKGKLADLALYLVEEAKLLPRDQVKVSLG